MVVVIAGKVMLPQNPIHTHTQNSNTHTHGQTQPNNEQKADLVNVILTYFTSSSSFEDGKSRATDTVGEYELGYIVLL